MFLVLLDAAVSDLRERERERSGLLAVARFEFTILFMHKFDSHLGIRPKMRMCVSDEYDVRVRASAGVFECLSMCWLH